MAGARLDQSSIQHPAQIINPVPTNVMTVSMIECSSGPNRLNSKIQNPMAKVITGFHCLCKENVPTIPLKAKRLTNPIMTHSRKCVGSEGSNPACHWAPPVTNRRAIRIKGVIAHSIAHNVEAIIPVFASLTRKDIIWSLALLSEVKDSADSDVIEARMG